MPRNLHEIEVANEIRLHICVRVLDRVADASLRTEVNNPVELFAIKSISKSFVISEISFDQSEGSAMVRLLLSQPIAL
jgi:hypothetical protein